MTFSINIGTDTETTSRDFDSILNDLYDNESKVITPRFVRDAVFSSWVNSGIKPTGDYIGVDSVNPADRDIKYKQFFGKRHLDGVDIMDSSLLSSDTDIFFFNTKDDSDPDNISTKLSFLAGDDPSLFVNAPYIEATTLAGTTSQSYDFINLSNDIGLNTLTDNVNVNGVIFPGPTAIPTNNDLMLWDGTNNVLKFEELTLTSPTLGATGATLSILSATSAVNGHPLEFTDLTPLPKTWNANLPIASTNQNEAINTMLYKLIYPYLPPLVDLVLCPPYASGYIEIGMNVLIPIKYTITKRTNKIVYFNLSNMISSTAFCPITGSGFITQTGILNGLLTPGSTTNNFTLTVIDDYVPPSTVMDTVTLTEVYPYFHGFGTTASSGVLNTYTKIIEPQTNQQINIFGTGDYYFIYDSTYGALSDILDGSDVSIFGSATTGTVILNSPDTYWGPKQYNWYKISVNELTPSQFYKFNF